MNAEELGRTSHEVRGLKYISLSYDLILTYSRTSHEVRGLKYSPAGTPAWLLHVAPHTRCVD